MTERMSECLLCGKEYEVCKLCPRVREFTPWRIDFDEPRHFQIYAIVQDIRANTLTNAEAKESLDRLHVTRDEVLTFVPSVQATLLPVLDDGKKVFTPKPVEPKVEEPEQPHKEKGKINAFKGRNKK